MKEKALYYHEKGYNCSFVILKAGAEKYGVTLPEEIEQGCCAVSSGFGRSSAVVWAFVSRRKSKIIAYAVVCAVP